MDFQQHLINLNAQQVQEIAHAFGNLTPQQFQEATQAVLQPPLKTYACSVRRYALSNPRAVGEEVLLVRGVGLVYHTSTQPGGPTELVRASVTKARSLHEYLRDRRSGHNFADYRSWFVTEPEVKAVRDSLASSWLPSVPLTLSSSAANPSPKERFRTARAGHLHLILLSLLESARADAEEDEIDWLLGTGSEVNLSALPLPLSAFFHPESPFQFGWLERGERRLARLLRVPGIDLSARNRRGNTLLHEAAHFPGRHLRLLLEDGRGDLRAVNAHGKRPLHVALDGVFISGTSRAHVELLLCFASREDAETWDGRVVLPEKYDPRPLVQRFLANPEAVRRELIRKHNVFRHPAALFARLVYFTDGYLTLHYTTGAAARFFALAARLPMELQMLLANRVYGCPETVIRLSESEAAFKALGRFY